MIELKNPADEEAGIREAWQQLQTYKADLPSLFSMNGLAREMRAASERGAHLGLTEDELAFYDALEANDSAVQVLGDETLRAIARELVETVPNNVTIDWTPRENVRAQLRVMVRGILNRYGYPTDRQERATLTVLEQAEALSEGWAAV